MQCRHAAPTRWRRILVSCISLALAGGAEVSAPGEGGLFNRNDEFSLGSLESARDLPATCGGEVYSGHDEVSGRPTPFRTGHNQGRRIAIQPSPADGNRGERISLRVVPFTPPDDLLPIPFGPTRPSHAKDQRGVPIPRASAWRRKRNCPSRQDTESVERTPGPAVSLLDNDPLAKAQGEQIVNPSARSPKCMFRTVGAHKMLTVEKSNFDTRPIIVWNQLPSHRRNTKQTHHEFAPQRPDQPHLGGGHSTTCSCYHKI
jgi:hypothetical protein